LRDKTRSPGEAQLPSVTEAKVLVLPRSEPAEVATQFRRA
jgi:hypothetical protein